jgi:8-oxo-dGTP pyrophosphatase MutT (NUDIX family)
MVDFLEQVRDALGPSGTSSSDFDLNPEYRPPADRVLRPAGVLVPILRTDGQWSVLLTKRSSALKHHPGQIAFPGGKQDEGDADIIACAMREAHEEVGLPPSSVNVLGTLPVHETVTGFKVTPVVAHVTAPFQIRPEAGEVDEAFLVPLHHVLSPANYVVQSRQWRGQSRSYFTVPYGPYYIWGATARMLRAWSDRMTS